MGQGLRPDGARVDRGPGNGGKTAIMERMGEYIVDGGGLGLGLGLGLGSSTAEGGGRKQRGCRGSEGGERNVPSQWACLAPIYNRWAQI